MFISSDQARARLGSRRNVFSDGHDRGGDRTYVIEPEVIEDAIEDVIKPDPLIDLSKLDELINRDPLRSKQPYRGRTEAQVAIGETALVVGQSQAGRLFGLSNEQSLAYERALSSTADITNHTPPNPSRKKQIDEFREVLAAKAAERLGDTLELLDTPKLKAVKRATNLSRIAKDMATIVEKVSPKETVDQGGVHFHIYKPEISVEQNYKVVTVGSKV